MSSKRDPSADCLLERINQAVRKTSSGEDLILFASLEHLKTIADFLHKDNNDKISEEEMSDVFLARIFLEKVNIAVPKKRFTCQVDTNAGLNIPLLPIDVFGSIKCNEDFRRDLFFNCLEVGDILDCRVVSVLANHCVLNVIYKSGSLLLLNDLNITVVLPANADDMSKLHGKLLKFDLLRVAVKDIQPGQEMKVSVTLNESVIPFKQNTVKLGKISEENIPPYVLDPPDVSRFRVCFDYMSSLRGLQNHLMNQKSTPKFGIESKYVYSFHTEIDNMQCPSELTGEALLETFQKTKLNELLDAASKAYRKEDFKLALRKVETVLEIDSNCQDAYILQGKIYLSSKNRRPSQKVIACWEKAYSLDPNNNIVKDLLSYALYASGCSFYQKKQYREASNMAERALSLKPNNSQAHELYDYLKLKHPEAFVNLDAVSLPDLQAEKKKIVTQLKEIDTSDVPMVKAESPVKTSDVVKVKQEKLQGK